jgi:hypothetical protein
MKWRVLKVRFTRVATDLPRAGGDLGEDLRRRLEAS